MQGNVRQGNARECKGWVGQERQRNARECIGRIDRSYQRMIREGMCAPLCAAKWSARLRTRSELLRKTERALVCAPV
jgi:hypothetical protein